MIKRGLLFFALIGLTNILWAQDEEEKKVEYEEPFEIPGNMLVDIGFNFLRDEGDALDLGFWGSKSIGIYYMYEWTWENSHFSINPGLGVGLEKYDFGNNFTLSQNDSTTTTLPFDSAFQANIFTFEEINKSKLAATYIEIPLEFRYYKNRRDHQRGFRIALGVKGGIRVGSHTKIKYEENGESIKLKEKRDFNLNPVRLSALGRVGFGGFSVFYEQALTNLFKEGEGPGGTEASYFKIGISFIGF